MSSLSGVPCASSSVCTTNDEGWRLEPLGHPPGTTAFCLHAGIHVYAGNCCHSTCDGSTTSTARSTAYVCTTCGTACSCTTRSAICVYIARGTASVCTAYGNACPWTTRGIAKGTACSWATHGIACSGTAWVTNANRTHTIDDAGSSNRAGAFTKLRGTCRIRDVQP